MNPDNPSFRDPYLTIIPGYEGIYGLSLFGEVYSYKHDRMLATKVLRSKHVYVTLSKYGVKKSYKVAQLVIDTHYTGTKYIVKAYRDGNMYNLKLSNLIIDKGP